MKGDFFLKKLVDGVQHFQANLFSSQRDLFERLASKQNPEALFITCADSRINPNLITNTDPGDLLIIRNAGNIIPSFGAIRGGEAATIELAITALGIKDITEVEVEAAIEELNDFYLETTRSFRIQNIAGGFQIRTDALFEPWLKEIFVKQKVEAITPAGNETLAIIAYKQPITKVEVDNIRGVDSGGHVRNLMEKELVEVCGKSSELGNPNLYGTTKKFLELYGLNTIEELPSVEDIKELA